MLHKKIARRTRYQSPSLIGTVSVCLSQGKGIILNESPVIPKNAMRNFRMHLNYAYMQLSDAAPNTGLAVPLVGR
jgi:uncharacterized membrane-anchored protein